MDHMFAAMGMGGGDSKAEAAESGAPLELMSQFLLLITQEKMKEALVVCNQILVIEPSNKMLLEYRSSLKEYIDQGMDDIDELPEEEEEDDGEEEEDDDASDDDSKSPSDDNDSQNGGGGRVRPTDSKAEGAPDSKAVPLKLDSKATSTGSSSSSSVRTSAADAKASSSASSTQKK